MKGEVEVTDVSTMEDRDLDEQLAGYCGWERKSFEHEGMRFHDLPWHDLNTDSYGPTVPAYSTDLNALRDGPERVLIEANGHLLVVSPDGSKDWYVEWRCWPDGRGPEAERIRTTATAPTEARARAEAALMALQVMKGKGNG
jgi:hypothetical protein